jgi:internalin A
LVRALIECSVFGLNRTGISDLAPLANLTKLETLGLSNTKVSDLSPLQRLPKLTILYISDSRIDKRDPELVKLAARGVRVDVLNYKKPGN